MTKRSSPGTGTQIVNKFEAAGVKSKSRWVRIVVKTSGTVLMVPLVVRILRQAWLEATGHEHPPAAFMDVLKGIAAEWTWPLLAGLLGITLLVPAIGVPVWRQLYKIVPAKFKGEK